jgi:alanyl-tRNA synthetase
MRKLTRGLLTASKLLQISDQQFFQSLVDCALSIYAKQHPALIEARDKTLQYLLEENDLFESTLKRGTRHLDSLLQTRENCLSAEDLVTIEKKYGVPKPLLLSMLKQRQVPFNRQAYQNAYAAWYQSVVD